MTNHQNEEQKRLRRMALLDTRVVSDVFPSVTRITIKCEVIHISAFGHIHKEYTIVKNPSSNYDFTIDCLNRECTEGWFDLKDLIRNMVLSKQKIISGEDRCKGKEAPDHMNQGCGGKLIYEIYIEYCD